MPAIVSSVGFLQVGHRDGEAGVARAAGDAGTIQFVSGVTNTPIEEIMAAASGPVFYQLYYIGGREASAPIIERVKRAGVSGLVLTVDTATVARPRDRRTRARERPDGDQPARGAALRAAGAGQAALAGRLPAPRPDRAAGRHGPAARRHADGPVRGHRQDLQQTPAWEDIAWIREHWDGPIVIKGILTAEDARRAVDEGADAIVVSNHGGNVLDGSVPTLRALPEIVDAVGDEIEVLMDGGVRRGTDVVKAVALGARAVLLGRGYVTRCSPPASRAFAGSSTCSTSRSTRRSPSSASSRSTSSTRRCSTCRSAGPGAKPSGRDGGAMTMSAADWIESSPQSREGPGCNGSTGI